MLDEAGLELRFDGRWFRLGEIAGEGLHGGWKTVTFGGLRLAADSKGQRKERGEEGELHGDFKLSFLERSKMCSFLEILLDIYT